MEPGKEHEIAQTPNLALEGETVRILDQRSLLPDATCILAQFTEITRNGRILALVADLVVTVQHEEQEIVQTPHQSLGVRTALIWGGKKRHDDATPIRVRSTEDLPHGRSLVLVQNPAGTGKRKGLETALILNQSLEEGIVLIWV